MKSLLMDVDTGIDDGFAILLALKSEQIKVQGITTVAGCTDLEQVTENTLKFLNLAGRTDIPIAKGARSSLRGTRQDATTTGEDGLCNLSGKLELPERSFIRRPAEEFMKEKLGQDGEGTVVATAPLTNIAILFQEYPEVKDEIERLVIMGGAVERKGNITSEAEFNFYVDPKAADQVLKADVPTTLVPLDVTEQVLIKKEWIEERYEQSGNPVTSFFSAAVKERYEQLGYDWMFLHDPLALGVAIDDSFVETKTDNLEVVRSGEEEGKVTKSDQEGKVSWAYQVDEGRFIRFFEDMLLES